MQFLSTMSHIVNEIAMGKAPMIEESESNVENQNKMKSIVVEESSDAIQRNVTNVSIVKNHLILHKA
ncbi:hypothetical protein TSUD_329340 [Trifolium subterraneum]|uniref:Uncharacterized protein n=1 Tax=Trifolium subterraneum TaxID=3900 RepID=A0A2Z6PGK0_TRISU|nr:hypothetical protein TSUD_329340 [Trifolium subterraneum]